MCQMKRKPVSKKSPGRFRQLDQPTPSFWHGFCSAESGGQIWHHL